MRFRNMILHDLYQQKKINKKKKPTNAKCFSTMKIIVFRFGVFSLTTFSIFVFVSFISLVVPFYIFVTRSYYDGARVENDAKI